MLSPMIMSRDLYIVSLLRLDTPELPHTLSCDTVAAFVMAIAAELTGLTLTCEWVMKSTMVITQYV